MYRSEYEDNSASSCVLCFLMRPRLIDGSTNKAIARAETCFGNVAKGMRFCPPGPSAYHPIHLLL